MSLKKLRASSTLPNLLITSAIYLPYEIVTVQVIVIESDAPLLTTEKTVLQRSVPPEEALKIPASVIAPVPSPAAKDAT